MTQLISRRALLCVAAGGAAGNLLGLSKARAALGGSAVYPVALPGYAPQFVAMTQGFFRDEGLDVQLIPAGSGVKMRDILASGQADIGIGDVTHVLQLTNRKRPARILSSIERRNVSVIMVGIELHTKGLTSIDQLATWKRADGGKPLVGVSSIGGTSYVWSSFFFEQLQLDQAVTFIAAGETDTMLGALKTKQIDLLVGSRSMLAEAEKRGWGRLLFDMGDKAVWDRIVGGDVPILTNFALASLIERDRPRAQSYTTALYRAARWIEAHSAEEVYDAIEQYVGSTSREANVIELLASKEALNAPGLINEEDFKRGGRVWFRETTGIKPLALNAVFDRSLIERAHAAVQK
ncbi:ABC transporter substrate-binding protein [Bradyrhizobium sp.]|uniref:ABC transporter substrate-binding protein n=1 Tax=Bradyrhizobium sp. TaxID=376 RepID=UPI0040378EDD